jgi:hypothetical protein
MSKTSKTHAPVSKTKIARVKAMRDEEINRSDIPELTSAQVAGGTLRMAGKVVSRGKKDS